MELITNRGYTVDSSLVQGVAGAYTASPQFPVQFAQANRTAHAWIFAGAPPGQDWVVDVAPMLRDRTFAELWNVFHLQVPATVTVPLTVDMPKRLRAGKLRPLTAWGPWLSVGATVLTGVSALLTLAVARSRGKALSSHGVSALLAGAAGWAGIEVAQRYINDALDHAFGDIRLIAEAMTGTAENSLHQWLNLTLAAGGVLVVFGVFVAMLGGLRRAG